MKTNARAIADVSSGTIFASVDIAAPPERVFQALVTESEVTRWWGSAETYRTTTWILEPRAGGKFRAEGAGAESSRPFSIDGEVLEYDPPRRLVHTWTASWEPALATTIAYRLDPIEGGTRLTVRHEGFGDNASACQGHAEGWAQIFGWLREHAAPAPAAYFFCRLNPPRPTFAFDMNEEERAIMQAHAGYWRKQLAAGRAIAFGPVADPGGAWGLGLIGVASEAEARAFEQDDPAIQSGRGFRYDLVPMLGVVF